MRTPLLTALALAAALAGCGSSKPKAPASTTAAATAPVKVQKATLVLDFTPNAVHTGIYDALARGLPRKLGVDLQVQAPGASTDAVKLLIAGRVQFAILDLHDLAIARAKDSDIVGVMALVQTPLAAVVAAPSITSPAALQGHTVGVTGVPSDEAVLHSIVSGAGGDPKKVHEVTIGFNAVADLLAHKVAGATAFWNDEGLTLQRKRPGVHMFRVEQFGAPAYPELVLCVSRSELTKNPELVAATVKALAGGYADTIRHPAAAVDALLARAPGLHRADVTPQLRALIPSFMGHAPVFGDVSPRRLRAWAAWEKRFGIVKTAPDTSAMFDDAYVPGAS